MEETPDALFDETAYYSGTRRSFPALLAALEAGAAPSGRALDVGCAFGHLGERLLALGYDEVWGVEPVATAAEAAATRLTRVIHGRFTDPAVDAGAPYDLIVFADSLEHMADPWDALRRARSLLSPTGQLLVSVPNVSHFSVIAQQLKGRWTYSAQGLLDRTHLRFFTPATIRDAVVGAGFACVAERDTLREPGGRLAWTTAALRRFVPHTLVFQHVVLARPLP